MTGILNCFGLRLSPRTRPGRRFAAAPAAESLEERILLSGIEVAGRTAGGQWWTSLYRGTFLHGSTETQVFAGWSSAVDWRHVRFGDYDGDTLQDIAGWDPGSGQWWVSLSDGDSSTTRLAGSWSKATTWSDVAAVDLAEPGDRGTQGHFTNKADLVGRAADGSWWGAVSNGDGTFRNVLLSHWDPSAGWRDVRFLDVNADGATDMLGRTSAGAWWASVSRGWLTYETVSLAQWNEAAGWRDVLVTRNFFQDGRDGIVARASDGGWWSLRFGAGGTAATHFLGSWRESAGWRDVMTGEFERLTAGANGSDIVGRNAAGEWWMSSWNGAGLTTRLIGSWDESAGWRDVRVWNGNTIVGRTATGRWWASQFPFSAVPQPDAMLAHDSMGWWAPDAGWRDVTAANVTRDPVELIYSYTQIIDIYAHRAGTTAIVDGGGLSLTVNYRVPGFAPRVFSFQRHQHDNWFSIRFNGHAAADLFRNASSENSTARGWDGGDAFYVRNNVAADAVFGGDGLDQLVTSDVGLDTFNQDG